MQTISSTLEIIGLVIAGLVGGSVVVGFVWIMARGRVKVLKRQDDDERLRPYREAADGYKLQVEQLERDVKRLQRECDAANRKLHDRDSRIRELESLTIDQAATLQRQQGELDRLKRQVEDLGDLRGQLNDVLAQIKNPTSR